MQTDATKIMDNVMLLKLLISILKCKSNKLVYIHYWSLMFNDNWFIQATLMVHLNPTEGSVVVSHRGALPLALGTQDAQVGPFCPSWLDALEVSMTLGPRRHVQGVRWGQYMTFPTLIISQKICEVGMFFEDKFMSNYTNQRQFQSKFQFKYNLDVMNLSESTIKGHAVNTILSYGCKLFSTSVANWLKRIMRSQGNLRYLSGLLSNTMVTEII